uniref:Glucocorticoid modulatory element-binding protein 2 n=1 Tax=Phallusia mammillata TaxID=59560 RepID=A0A6F9DEE3_9ASCI|nr:glucocorticoid modulatory element-binding protein 2 [Phallusia mammillata]
MEKPASSPTTNIVATAMSTANVISPESPQVSTVSLAPETTQHISQQSSGSPRPRSSAPLVDQMEVGNSPSPQPTRSLLKQASQDCDSPAPRPMETAPPNGHFTSEDHEKTVVLLSEPRNDGKEPHLVTVTPPTSIHQAMNGDTRPAGIFHYSHDRSDPMLTASHMHLLPKDYKSDSHTELEKPSEDTTYPITCGNNKADLVWKKFICPGINAKCVKCGDQWLTPKEFVNCAGKSTLKDWKRAIRINGTMLRKLIESGELNYYDHDNNCSNQCRSNKNSSFDNSDKPYNSFESDPRDLHSYRSMPSQPSADSLPARSNSEDLPYLGAKRQGMPKSQESNTSLSITGSLERSSSEDSGLAPSPHLDSIIMKEVFASAEKLQDLQNFWNGIIRSELFDDIVRDVITHITNLHAKTKVTNVVSVEDAGTLTNLVSALEMIPTITQRLSVYKHNMEEQAEKSNQAIQGFLLAELEKKLAEQKKYEQDLKRKSQHLDSVMPLIPNEKRQKRAMLRFVRQKAVESRIPPGVMPGTSTSPVPASRIPDVMMSSRVPNWPQALQVIYDDATSTQLSRLNVSGCVASAIPPGIAPMFLTHTNMHNPPEGFTSNTLPQAFIASQHAHHSPRDTQSPKK